MRAMFSGILGILLISVIIVLCSCDDSGDKTSPKASISGHISLEADTLQGIQIGVYTVPEINSEVTTILDEYPQIGVPLTARNTFDHRLHTPVKTAETNSDGNFTVKDIPQDEYIVVACHPKYGFAYHFNVVVDSNTDHVLDESIQLYPVTYYDGLITTPAVFETGHHYILGSEGNDITISSATIEPGAVIRIATDRNLTLYGVILPSTDITNPYWFTSNDLCDDLVNTTRTTPDFFNRITLYQGNAYSLPLQAGRLSFANDGINCQHPDMYIKDFIFDTGMRGFTMEYSSTASITISNCIFMNYKLWSEIDNRYVGQGILVSSDEDLYTSLTLNYNLFYGNREGIRIKYVDGDLFDNFCFGNYIGFRTIYCYSDIHNNCYDQNSFGISLSASNDTIRFNNFYNDTSNIETNLYYVQNSYHYCLPNIYQNNFYGENNHSINTFGTNSMPDSWGQYYQGISRDITSPNNYFETSDIDESIIDGNDYEENHLLNHMVFYNPISIWQIDGAGIR